jgi:Spy/CpxP family protein refolding chaperone
VNAWKPILAALVIFAAGVVTGGLTVKLRAPPFRAPFGGRPFDLRPGITQRWEGQIRELSKRMEKQLSLTPEQRSNVEAIIRDGQKRMRGIGEEIAPRTREEFRQMRQKIRAELTPAQRKKFEELFKEGEVKHEEKQPQSVPDRR